MGSAVKRCILAFTTEQQQRKQKTGLTWSEIVELGIAKAESQTLIKNANSCSEKQKHSQ